MRALRRWIRRSGVGGRVIVRSTLLCEKKIVLSVKEQQGVG